MYRLINNIPFKIPKYALHPAETVKALNLENRFHEFPSKPNSTREIVTEYKGLTCIAEIGNLKGTPAVFSLFFPNISIKYEFCYVCCDTPLRFVLNSIYVIGDNNTQAINFTYSNSEELKEINLIINKTNRPGLVTLCPNCLATVRREFTYKNHYVITKYSECCDSHELLMFYTLGGKGRLVNSIKPYIPSAYVSDGPNTNLAYKRLEIILYKIPGIPIKDGRVWFHKDGVCINLAISEEFGKLLKCVSIYELLDNDSEIKIKLKTFIDVAYSQIS